MSSTQRRINFILLFLLAALILISPSAPACAVNLAGSESSQPDRNVGNFAGSAFVRAVQKCRSARGPWRLQSLLRPVQDFWKRDQYRSCWCHADGLRGTVDDTGNGIFLSPRGSKNVPQRQNQARALRRVRQRAGKLDTDRLGLIEPHNLIR
jgi:hypothetical protein